MSTSEEIHARLDRMRERLAKYREEHPQPEKPEKRWSEVPLASTEAEADEYIVKHVNEFHQIVINEYGQGLNFDTSDAVDDCVRAFVRHIVHLYDIDTPAKRIERDVAKIWETFLNVAKTINVGKDWEMEDWGLATFKNLDAMRRFTRGPMALLNIAGVLDLEYLQKETPQKGGRVGFTDEHNETWTEEDREEFKANSPWWNLRVDCFPKAALALSAPVPNDESMWDSVPDEDGDYGPLRNMLGREINTPPEQGMYGNMEEWRRVHAFVATLFQDQRGFGYKARMWPLRNALKVFRDALEEERGFKVGLGKQPDVAVLTSVMPVWIECAGRNFLNEIESNKRGSSQEVCVAPGPLAAKAIRDTSGFITKKRWNFWKDRCGEVYTAAHENYQTTLKVEKKGLKFWKRSSKPTLPKVGEDLAEDVEGAHGRWETKGNLLALHKYMEKIEAAKAADDKEFKEFEKRLKRENR